MAATSIPVLAGIASTVIFASSALPMLVKARRTRDLASYSLGNIGLSNLGNAVHSVYVFSLPPGPIWALHTFYLLTSAVMLVWFLQYGAAPRRGSADRPSGAPTNGSFCRRQRPSARPSVEGPPSPLTYGGAPCPRSTSRP